MKRKQTFDEKNDLIFVRPKKIIEQVKTFDGETDFIVPRKNTYVDKRNNTIVSLARDNSHSSVDTVGEYANAAAAPSQVVGTTGGANLTYTVQVTPSVPTCQGIGVNVNVGGATGGNVVVSGQYTATNQAGSIVASQSINQNGLIFNLPLLSDASGNLLDANVAYTISLSYSDTNGSGIAQPVQTNISGQLGCNVSGSGSGSGGGTGATGTGVLGNYGTGAVANANPQGNQNQQNQQVTAFGTTIIKNVPAVTITNFNASSAVLQPDTISVNVSYQDGKAPYTVSYTITDPNGVVILAKDNTTTNLQDSLQPPASGLSAGGYVVTVNVKGSDGSNDSKTENVNVKGTPTPKFTNLSVSASNPTTSGFDMSTSWSGGISPYQVNAVVKSGGLSTAYNSPSVSSVSDNWVQSLIIDNSGNPVFGTYDIDVEVIDAMGNKLNGTTQIYVSAPKPQPLTGQLVATNIQNASFDVSYKFANGVAPFSLVSTLYYAPDASGNAQSFPITQSGLSNLGTFPIVITPDASGAVIEGYYKLVNSVVTDANGQTANLNDIAPYLNGVKGTTTPPPSTPPTPTVTTTTTTITGGGGIIGGGGGGGAQEPAPEEVVAKEKTGINWLLVIIALGVGYAIIRKKQ